jgi:tetratricopeptide (TPR) repeat protein
VPETACHSYIVPIFGPETCASGIENLVAATRATASQLQRRAIVDVAAKAMRRLTVAQGLSEEDRSRFSDGFGQILREWINSGAATATAYVLWAQHPESGLDESVVALERALELEPDNGQYRYWLSMAYIAQRRFDEAIENLTIARDTLPDNVGISTESVDTRIRQAESERDRRR